MYSLKRGGKIGGWNWGAFLLTWVWGVANGVWISLLAIIPGVNLVMAVILGIKGNDWAWRKNSVYSKEEFFRVQKIWARWGLIVAAGCIVLSFLSLYALTKQVEKSDEIDARDNQRIADVKTIMAQVNNYKLDHGQDCPKALSDLIPRYISEIPMSYKDENYRYYISGQDCYLSLQLENKENPSLLSDSSPGNGAIFDQKSEDISYEIIWGDNL